MKTAWCILLASAITDFVITFATGLMSAMMATGVAMFPNKTVVLLAVLGGVLSGGRTIQQALKTTPEVTATLRGADSVVVTTKTVESVENNADKKP